MNSKEAVIWLINLAADIGKAEHRDLWHYEQALCEIKEIIESSCSEIPNSSDCIDRAEAQTAIQFAARRYTVAHEAHGEGHVVWSDNLISITDAMNALSKVPSAQPEQERFLTCNNCIHLGHGYMMPCKNCRRNQMMPDWYEVET